MSVNGQRVVEFTPDILLWPASIVPGGTFVSPVLPSLNFPKAFFSVVSSQGGSLIVSRFADRGGTIKIDGTTALMTASVAASVSLIDAKYSRALQLKVNNTSTTQATLTSFLGAVSL